jgi:hypothetical protein
MRLVKSILYGAILLALASGSATAIDEIADAPSDSMSMDASAGASTMYEVDEDRDGRTDRTLELEQSDSLA